MTPQTRARRSRRPANAVRLAAACGLAGLVIAGRVGFSARIEAGETTLGHPQSQQQNVEGEIKVLPVRENVFMLVGGGGNITVQVEPPKTIENHFDPFLPSRQGVFLVDTGLAPMRDKLVATIHQLSKGAVRFIINTNGDAAHAGGNEGIVKAFSTSGGGRAIDLAPPLAGVGPTILVQENVLTRMSSGTGQATRPTTAQATIAFDTDKQLVFNGESIQILHVPAAHTDGDTIVFFRRSDVISAGDIFVTDSYPIFDAESGGSIQGILDGLNLLLEIAIPGDRVEDGTLVIPGHGRLSDYADVNEYRNTVTIIRDRIQDLIDKGMTLEQVKAARPSKEYDRRYSTPAWTTDMFVTAVYRDLAMNKKQ